jgi:hypothetical protein
MSDMTIKVRPVPVAEALENPDVFIERVEEAVRDFLEKHDCEFKLQEFVWAGGAPSATIGIVKKP